MMARRVMMRCLLDILTNLSLMTKKGSSFEMRVVILVGGGLVQKIGGVLLRDVARIFVSFLFFLFQIHYFFVYWSYDHLTYIVLIFDLYILMYVIHLSFHVLFLFFLYTHVSYMMYAILYFCFTLKCLDEFCLKYFRNIGCESLLAINFLLAKFFKSLCQDRFYCIQQVNMS